VEIVRTVVGVKQDSKGKPLVIPQFQHSRKINGKVKLAIFFQKKSNGYHTFFAA
jgi:hypothetical protein